MNKIIYVLGSMAFLFCHGCEEKQREAAVTGGQEDENCIKQDRQSFIRDWGEPSIVIKGDDDEVTLTYLTNDKQIIGTSNVVGFTARFKADKLIIIQPITKSDRVSANLDLSLISPDPEIVFSGRDGLEQYLQQISFKSGVSVISEDDKEKLRQLLIQGYYLSQSKGLYEECVVTAEGAFWDLIIKHNPETKQFIISNSKKRRVDIKSLVEFWQK